MIDWSKLSTESINLGSIDSCYKSTDPSTFRPTLNAVFFLHKVLNTRVLTPTSFLDPSESIVSLLDLPSASDSN